MSTHLNAVPGSPMSAQGAGPATMAATRPFYWSVRRELWECRYVYIAPVAVAAVYTFAELLRTATLPHRMPGIAVLDPAKQRASFEQPYLFATGVIMAVTFIVGVYYCLEALHGERRDRSILFWKSLPVSDLSTVLAKASIPLVFLPGLTIVLLVVTQWTMLLLKAAVLMGTNYSYFAIWSPASLARLQLLLIYHLISVHTFWYAPIYGWLLLVSAWAKRSPFLWAFLPFVAIGVAEKVLFNTTYVVQFVGHRISGPEAYSMAAPGDMPAGAFMTLAPGKFLSEPGLWLGLIATAIFLAIAVRLRRYREPI